MPQTKIDKLFPQWPKELILHDGDIVCEWCCDCHLRHIKHYRFERDEQEQLVVVVRCEMDDVATELKRFYEREMKKRRKHS